MAAGHAGAELVGCGSALSSWARAFFQQGLFGRKQHAAATDLLQDCLTSPGWQRPCQQACCAVSTKPGQAARAQDTGDPRPQDKANVGASDRTHPGLLGGLFSFPFLPQSTVWYHIPSRPWNRVKDRGQTRLKATWRPPERARTEPVVPKPSPARSGRREAAPFATPASAQPSCSHHELLPQRKRGTNGNLQLGAAHGFGEGTPPAHVQAPCGLAQLGLPQCRAL